MFDRRKRLKLDLHKNENREAREQLDQLEIEIADKIDEQFRSKVKNNLAHITGDDGAINTNGMWSIKNSLLPKHTKSNLIAIKDSKGNLATSPARIKQLSLEKNCFEASS